MFVVVIAQDLVVRQFETTSQLKSFLQTKIEENKELPVPAKAVIVEGKQLFLTKGYPKYLIFGNQPIPLFSDPSEPEPDTEGNLGYGTVSTANAEGNMSDESEGNMSDEENPWDD